VSRFVYATKTNVPDYMKKGGVFYRIFSDNLGSPRLVVDNSNGDFEEIDYDAFGNVTKDTKPPGFQGSQPFGFAGGLYDQDTKVVRFGWRDYDPTIGRWTSKDLIMFAGGHNVYAYSLNDPVNMRDPTGLWYLDLNMSVGYGVGLTFGVQIGSEGQGIFPYIGGGLVNGFSYSWAWSPNNPTVGPQWQASVGAGACVNVGLSSGIHQGDASSWFWEIGAMAGVGGSLTLSEVFSPIGEMPNAWAKRVLDNPDSGRNNPNPFDNPQSNPGYPYP
jgi:RHS repeat-associated protein